MINIIKKYIEKSTIIENIPYIFILWKLIIERKMSNKIKFVFFVLLCLLLNTILKNIIKSPRPIITDKYGELQKYGMPSGHSQIIWFILFYKPKQDIQHLIGFIIAILSSYQRIITKNHYIEQVIIGSIIGIIFAYVCVSVSL